ncbi:hypothetical protein CVT26_003870 [Gymnopilus dilepis]|uniref:Uncharacterized protein n=1 Tax=Gymnopilus dilepis TaxID=231916 RepID=A0A409WKK7_9AGAR|nr:hypothetical protein CVT26_003870 [Gymnopilus dilepis]
MDVDGDATDGYSSDDSLYWDNICRMSGRSEPSFSSSRMKISYICSSPMEIVDFQRVMQAGGDVNDFARPIAQRESMATSPGSAALWTAARPSLSKDDVNVIRCVICRLHSKIPLLIKIKVTKSGLTFHELFSRQSSGGPSSKKGNRLKKRRKAREYPYQVRFVEESAPGRLAGDDKHCNVPNAPWHSELPTSSRKLHPMKEVHDVMMVLDWRNLLKKDESNRE